MQASKLYFFFRERPKWADNSESAFILDALIGAGILLSLYGVLFAVRGVTARMPGAKTAVRVDYSSTGQYYKVRQVDLSKGIEMTVDGSALYQSADDSTFLEVDKDLRRKIDADTFTVVETRWIKRYPANAVGFLGPVVSRQDVVIVGNKKFLVNNLGWWTYAVRENS
jgi:hypothetical protein